MTVNATPNNRRPSSWWYLPPIVVTLFMGFAALTGNCTLYGGVGCGSCTAVLGSAPNRQFVIEWRTVYYSPNTQRANFEVILYEGIDRIDMVYGLVDQGGSSATVGVQRDTGTSRWTQFEGGAAGSRTTNLLLISAPGPGVAAAPPPPATPGGTAHTPARATTAPGRPR